MRRRWKVLIALGVIGAALLAINAIVVDSDTRGAEVTADGAEIKRLSSVDLQVLDMPAQTERPGEEGAPIVLLHGYATSLHWFEQLAPLLNARHRVISVDLIGHGGSEKPKSGFTIEEQATAVAEALSMLDVEAATVVGHSMGGYVAAELANQASDLVNRVAVLGTPATDDGSSLPFLARLTYAPVVGEAIWRLRFPGVIKGEYESAFAPGFDMDSAFGNPDQVVEDNDAMTFTSYDGAGAGARDFIQAESMVTRLNRSAVPFLAVLGSEDEIVDSAEAAEQYEGVPGAQINIFDGVGHSPHLEAPADTAELLLRFAGAGPKASASAPREPGRAVDRRLQRTLPTEEFGNLGRAVCGKGVQRQARRKQRSRLKALLRALEQQPASRVRITSPNGAGGGATVDGPIAITELAEIQVEILRIQARGAKGERADCLRGVAGRIQTAAGA